jgi:hypothetical protein
MRKRPLVKQTLNLLSILLLAIAITGGGAAVGAAQSRIVNVVHAGGPDVQDTDWPGSGPGFDKDYSLIAFKYADGTASGQLNDRWADGVLPGTTALHADINCVHVVGNIAWVSGVITQGTYIDPDVTIDLTGWYVRTRVQDNGRNNDPDDPDRIAISQVRSSAPFVCSNMFMSPFLDMPRGQVTVR